MKPIIEVRNLSKVYQLGSIGARSLREEVERCWARIRKRQGGNGHDDSKPSGEFWALKDVSFEVQPGEVLGIIGRNGAGKSTLLKILSRITQQTSGEITLRGRVASLLEVGTGFHPDLTGRENIFLNGAILGMSKSQIRAKLEEIIAFAEVERFIETPVKRYSSGMYVRLAFAVGAHLDSEILILDEVLAVGDFAFQAKCMEKIKQIARSGRTILFVSHNLYAVQTLCSRALVLQRGEIAIVGEMHKAIAAFKNFAARDEEADKAVESSLFSGIVNLRSVSVNGRTERQLDVSEKIDLEVVWNFETTEPLFLNFGFSIKSTDGVYVSGLSTFVEGAGQTLPAGAHQGGIRVPGLDLPSGTYDLALAIMDKNGVAKHFFSRSVAQLSVSHPFRFDGVVGLAHHWMLKTEPPSAAGCENSLPSTSRREDV